MFVVLFFPMIFPSNLFILDSNHTRISSVRRTINWIKKQKHLPVIYHLATICMVSSPLPDRALCFCSLLFLLSGKQMKNRGLREVSVC